MGKKKMQNEEETDYLEDLFEGLELDEDDMKELELLGFCSAEEEIDDDD